MAPRLTVLVLLTLLGAAPAPLPAADDAAPERSWSLAGDLRLRLERDWDSVRPDGSERDDRDRARLRARLGLEVAAAPGFSLGLRLRTGSAASQQSPHVTLVDFSGGPAGDRDLLADRWVARLEGERGWLRLGRDGFPFWKQNELFWDDDATLAGLAAAHRLTAAPVELSVRAAYLLPPDGGRDFHGRLLAGQAILSGRRGALGWVAASGLYRFDGAPGAEHLADGNGERDGLYWVTSLQATRTLAGRPFVLGLDRIANLEHYSPRDPDPFTAAHHDQTDGTVLSARWGATDEPGAWSVGYTWARIETLAVNASFAQDDWVRWGSATQTASSDFRGHELRLARALGRDLTLVARLFVAEALTSRQDGKRLRVDLDYRF